MKKTLALVAFCLGLGVAGAQVTDVRIDFGTNGSSPSNANGIWNSVAQNASPVSLANSDGTATGATLTLYNAYGSATGAISTGWATMNGTFYGNGSWLQDYAAADSWEVNPGWLSFYFTISGLDDTKQYRIDLVGSDSYTYTGSDMGNYTINSAYADTTQLGTGGPTASQNWSQVTGGYTSQNWMVWSAISPSSGVFQLNVDYVQGYSGINAMRITELTSVPEPMSATLLAGLGVLACAIVLRRRTTVRNAG